MGEQEKIQNKVEEIRGSAKEQIGDVTGNEDLQAEGTVEKAKGSIKQAGEKLKDAFRG